MSSWQCDSRIRSTRHECLDELQFSPLRNSFQLSKRYQPSKVLLHELEECKEQLGQWEVRAVAAEAEVTSLGFQKVAMELDIAKYKEQVESLTRELNSEKAKSHKSSVTVLKKIAHIKDVLTKQMDELNKSEKEARLSLESIQQSVSLFKSGALSKDAFYSQVEIIFDHINNRKTRPNNGEKLHSRLSSFHHIAQTSQLSITEEGSLSHNDHTSDSLSPPPIPPKTPITDDARQLQHKKPVPPPRRRPRQVSSPDTFGAQPEIESHDVLQSRQVSSPDLTEPEIVSRLSRRRHSSRVDSLYSLAPPPGSPKDAPGGFVFRAKIDWSLSSDSAESDYENVIPPNRRLSTDITYAGKLDSPPSTFVKHNSKLTLVQSNGDSISQEPLSPSKIDSPLSTFAKHNSKLTLVQSNGDSISQEPLSPSKIHKDDKLIKKSSPIMTKRPNWFKRDSVTSTRTTPDLKLVPTNNTQKRRSRSLDACMLRKVSCPVDQFQDQPVALSDSEDTTRSNESYPKSLHRMRKRFITSRPTTSSSSVGCIDNMLTTSANWHCYDDDSEAEDVYYINPNEVASRFTPKQSTVDPVIMADSDYLMLTEPELAKIVRSSPQRRVGVSAHSPSPLPIPSSESHVPKFRDEKHSLRTDSRGMSDATSESGNDGDSEENDSGNIYENLDNDNHDHIRNAFSSSMSTDDIYAQIDEIQDSINPIPTYLSVSKPSSTENIAAVVSEHQRFDTSDMAKEDGYARVGVRRDDQAPSLPPRPPNFTRVRPRNHVRTVLGIGSLPRYTTLGGSEKEVQLVPIDQSGSWQSSESLDVLPHSPPGPTPRPDSASRSPQLKTLLRKSMQHFSATPNLHSSEERPLSEQPSYNSPSSSPPLSVMAASRKVPVAPKKNSTLPPAAVQKSTPSTTLVPLEKSGYLTLHDGKQKSKKKTSKWFVLQGTELKYYASKDRKEKEARRKTTSNTINLDKCCKLSTTDSRTGFQLDICGKAYRFSAADEVECEEWLSVITAAMQGVRPCSDSPDEEAQKRSLSGWARMNGSSQQVWCFLEGSSLVVTLEPGAEPIRRLDIERCSVKSKRDSIMLDTSASNLSQSMNLVLNIRDKETREITLLQPIKPGKIHEWCYILNSLRCDEVGPELTRTEQFLSEIMKDNPISHLDHPKWGNPIFKVTANPMHDSLISMPTTKLKEHARSLFRDLQQFMNKTIDLTNLDFHMYLAQKIIGHCLSHSHLQNEVYCQLLRQMAGHTTPTATPVLQGWLLLFMLIPMYLPSRKLISWYLTIFLDQSISSKSPVISELARNCQNRAKQCSTSSSRQCTPTYFELKTLFEDFSTSPFQPPTGSMESDVTLSDGSVHNVVFSAMTTVSKLVSQLTERVGLPDSLDTGFALMCDWPGVSDGLLCCPFVESKVCDVISMWSLSMEELNRNSIMAISEQRSITFTYKRRLAFQDRQGDESGFECILLAHQISNNVLTGVHPVPPKDAVQLSAIMAQLEYGNCESVAMGELDTVAREAVERFSPWSHTFMALEHEWLRKQAELTKIWCELAGKSREECARLYLSIAQTWSLCGAAIFKAEQHTGQNTPHQHLFLAIHEGGVSLLKHRTMDVLKSYSYNEISTFGGHGEEDFMLVVTPRDDPGNMTSVTTRGEKLLLSMDKIQICEGTFLMASYIESLKESTEHL